MTIKEAMRYSMSGKCIPYKKEVKKCFADFIRFYDDDLNTCRDRVHELNCENEELKKENQKLSKQLENDVNYTECLEICLETMITDWKKQKKYIERLEEEVKEYKKGSIRNESN